MKFLRRNASILLIAAKRLLAQRGLALATICGLLVAVALTMSIPLYADAIYYNTLWEELGVENVAAARNSDAPVLTTTSGRSPFAFMFRYIGSIHENQAWSEIEPVDAYLSGAAAQQIGLPHEQTVRYVKSEKARLFPTEDLAYADARDPLTYVELGFISDFNEHIELIEGELPAVADSNVDVPVDVLISEQMALDLGLQVNEQYVTFFRDAGRNVQIPVRIAGVWRATDPDESYWFYRVESFADVFLIPEASFHGRVGPLLDGEVALALWYLLMDGRDINASEVGGLLGRINGVSQRAASLLANTSLDISPVEPLERYQRASRVLTILLYAFSIPIVGLLLAFIGLVVGLAVARQRNEIAVLRSRGATSLQVLGIAGVEALLLAAVAFIIGVPGSQGVARVIGATRSFLDFTADTDLRIGFTLSALQFGLVAVAATFVAQVIPSLGAARHTVVSYKVEQARTVRSPWWQRAWLDVLLLIPAVYGAYLLSQQGSIALPGTGAASNNVFDNPLLFLVPALGTLALTLFVLRLLPLLMRAVAWLAARTESVSLLMATRYLARNPGLYTAPLVLLILTLSLSAFTASLARTLDNNLYDSVYYGVGADAQLIELGESSTGDASGAPGGESGGGDAAESGEESWSFIPVSEHLRAPEIEAVARVGEFDARIQAGDSFAEAQFFGIDRIDFAQTAFWRRDFAPADLGALMNALAVAPEGVLMPGDFLRANAIRVGDPVVVRISRYGTQMEYTARVVGEFDYFPTWYPAEDPPLIVGNLDYAFLQLGGAQPYRVWARTTPDASFTALRDNLREFDIQVLEWRSARSRVADEQVRPERQGLFGVLSVGFLAAALLTVLGFLLYTLFSFRRRSIELGTLRAVGLSPRQMTLFLTWEMLFLLLISVAAGTGIGALVSAVFIPYLQIGSDAASLTPPFVVELAWPAIVRIYVLFGILFVVALGVLVILLRRMKIFQAIKLGETV